MVLRIRRNPETARSGFERTALRVTGASFYVLAVGLAATAVYNLITGHKPETTLPGVLIALISIAVMWALVWGKRRTGVALSCSPILADANCTMVCIYMSVVLLAASLIYQFTGFGFVDSLGALGLIYYSVREGRESFEKGRRPRRRLCGLSPRSLQEQRPAHRPVFVAARASLLAAGPAPRSISPQTRTSASPSRGFPSGTRRPPAGTCALRPRPCPPAPW